MTELQLPAAPKTVLFPAKSPHKVRHMAGKEWQVMWQLLALWKHTAEEKYLEKNVLSFKGVFFFSRHPSNIFAIKPRNGLILRPRRSPLTVSLSALR